MSKDPAEPKKLRPVDRIEYDTPDGVPVIRFTAEEIAAFAKNLPTSNKNKDCK